MKRVGKILYLVLEMDIGGLQRVVNQLIRMIDREAFEPYICCLDRGGIFYEQTASDCAGSFVLGRRPGPFDGKMIVQLFSILKKNRIDIIHSHNGCSSYAALAGRLAGVKRIVHTDHGRLVPDKMSAILEDRLSSRMMNSFVGVSSELTDYLASTVKISKRKLVTIINGVDSETFKPRTTDERRSLRSKIGISDNDKVIGTVCRLDPIKNLGFLISCMPSIIKKVPEAKLVIVGNGPRQESLVRLSEDLGMRSKVICFGQREDIQDILPAFDVYACTSLSEGTSLTILEAMACGLPIIASSVGGSLRLVDASNGGLFPLNDADRFVELVGAYLSDSALRDCRGRKSREKVESSFKLDSMVRQYEKLYL